MPSYVVKKVLQTAAPPQLIGIHQVETIATDLTGDLFPLITSRGSAHLVGSLNDQFFSILILQGRQQFLIITEIYGREENEYLGVFLFYSPCVQMHLQD